MKKCKFCDSIHPDHVQICPSCDAREFLFLCNNCGTAYDKGNFCPLCGVQVNAKAKICPACGKEYYTRACPDCGYLEQERRNPARSVQQVTVYEQPLLYDTEPQILQPQGRYKSKWVAFLLCVCFGYFGAHKFYEGRPIQGLLYLFTCGFGGIAWLIDCVILLLKPNPYLIKK